MLDQIEIPFSITQSRALDADATFREFLDEEIARRGLLPYRNDPDQDLIGLLRGELTLAGFYGLASDCVLSDICVALLFRPGSFWDYDIHHPRRSCLEQRWVQLVRSKISNAVRDRGRKKNRPVPLSQFLVADGLTFEVEAPEQVPARLAHERDFEAFVQRFLGFLKKQRGGETLVEAFFRLLSFEAVDPMLRSDLVCCWKCFVPTEPRFQAELDTLLGEYRHRRGKKPHKENNT